MTTDRDSIGTTFLEVVEKLTFMFGEELPKADLPEPEGDYSVARIQFDGAVAGAVSLVVPEELVPEIAGNILGLDPDEVESTEMMQDAVRELLNVACGHVVMELAGAGADFTLAAPVYTIVGADAYAAYRDDDDSFAFLLEDSPALLNLKLGREAP